MYEFLERVFSIFNLFSSSNKSYDDISKELDNKMQDLYDRMGWGQYKKPSPMSGWNDACDLNRVLEAEQSFMDEIYSYNTRQITTTIKKTFSNKRDPARPRVNKYL